MKHLLKHHRSHHAKNVTLRRNLGLFRATCAGVGIIVGAGIYALIGAAAGLAGNMVWLSFLISAIVAACTGLAYAELSSLFPKSDGEFSYTLKAFSSKALAFVIGYLVILSGVVGAAAVALGFAGYLSQFVPLSLLILAVLCILIFSLVNFWGIEQSSRLNVVFTFFEVGALVIIVLLSLGYFGSVDYTVTSSAGLTGVFSAAALIFFAYTGFESVVKLSEETKNARKTIPRALVLSVVITMILYMLVGISAVSVVGWDVLAVSKAPLALVAQTLMNGIAGIILSIVALFSTGNTVLILLVTTSRMLYGFGKDFKKLKILSRIHVTRRTPFVAVLLTGLVSALFVLLGKNINFIAILFLTFFVVNISVIALRFNKKSSRVKNTFRIPFSIFRVPVLSVLGALFCIFMLFNVAVIEALIGFGLTIFGFGLYWIVKK